MKNPILTIYKKELLDIFRDKRTLFTSILLPIAIFPLLINLVGSFMASNMKKEMQKELRIGVDRKDKNAQKLIEQIDLHANIVVKEGIASQDFERLIKADSLDAGILVSPDFDTLERAISTAKITFYLKSTGSDMVQKRMKEQVEAYKEKIVKERLEKFKLPANFLEPISMEVKDFASSQEVLAKMIGGIVPYLLLIFCLVSCMYPALDLFAGEKEKGILETILVTPVRRSNILIGKMGVVATMGVLAAFLQIVGMYIGYKLNAQEGGIGNLMDALIKPQSILLLFCLLVFIAIFFAGLTSALSIYAKSFKEGMSLLQPLNFIIIIPILIGMMPGIEYNVLTALVPILNVSLAIKEILAGTLNYGLFALTMLSLVSFAVLVVVVCSRWYANESNILRV